jgi:hypothetical protein
MRGNACSNKLGKSKRDRKNLDDRDIVDSSPK